MTFGWIGGIADEGKATILTWCCYVPIRDMEDGVPLGSFVPRRQSFHRSLPWGMQEFLWQTVFIYCSGLVAVTGRRIFEYKDNVLAVCSDRSNCPPHSLGIMRMEVYVMMSADPSLFKCFSQCH